MVGRRSIAPARAVTENDLESLGLDVEPSGLVLGRDSASAPVLVRLFGSEPVRVAFVGGWWAAQILAGRCLAHGANLVVDAFETPTPGQFGLAAGLSQWLALDRAAGGNGQRVRPMAGDATLTFPASATQPLLRLHDAGPGGPASWPELQPWQTQLIVISRVTAQSVPLLAGVDLVLAQRLDPLEAGLVGSALLLASEFVTRLGAMDNEMIAAYRGRAVRYVWLNPTALERQLFG
jgi:hypothetical protein